MEKFSGEMQRAILDGLREFSNELGKYGRDAQVQEVAGMIGMRVSAGKVTELEVQISCESPTKISIFSNNAVASIFNVAAAPLLQKDEMMRLLVAIYATAKSAAAPEDGEVHLAN
jgi:hypothetical protein